MIKKKKESGNSYKKIQVPFCSNKYLILVIIINSSGIIVAKSFKKVYFHDIVTISY